MLPNQPKCLLEPMHCLAMLIIFLFTFSANAQSLHSIELQHRNAASLIPLVEPLLNQDEAVSGNHSLLIIKAKESRYQELRQLIEQLDTPLKQMLIEIKSPDSFRDRNSRQQSQVVISNKSQNSISYSSRNTFSTRSKDSIHQIKVLDGYTANIEDGRLVPLLSESFRFGLDPQDQGIGLHYFKTASSITVRPRLHGATVTLEIMPHYSELDRESNSEIRLRSSATTITVPLNTWTSLSKNNTKTYSKKNNTLSTRIANNDTQVRVTLIP